MRNIYLTVFICIIQLLFSQINGNWKSVKYYTNNVLTRHAFVDTNGNPIKYLFASGGITCMYYDSLDRIQQQIDASISNGIEMFKYEYKEGGIRTNYKYWLQEDFDKASLNKGIKVGGIDLGKYLYIKEVKDCKTLEMLPDVELLKKGKIVKLSSTWYNDQKIELLYHHYGFMGDTNIIITREYDSLKHFKKVITCHNADRRNVICEISHFDYDSKGNIVRNIITNGNDTLEITKYNYYKGILLSKNQRNLMHHLTYLTIYKPLNTKLKLLKSEKTICRDDNNKLLFTKVIVYKHGKGGRLENKSSRYKSKANKSKKEREVYEYW